MATTGLLGPHRLNFDDIHEIIAGPSPGVFALGYRDSDGTFLVNHVGRSDADLRERLRDFIGAESLFKFRLFASPQAAFLKECELFHDFRPPCTRWHPERPAGTDWTCPRCLAFLAQAR